MEQYISNNQWKSYVGVFTKANSGRAPAPAALDDLRPPRGDPTHWSLNNQVRARCWRLGRPLANPNPEPDPEPNPDPDPDPDPKPDLDPDPNPNPHPRTEPPGHCRLAPARGRAGWRARRPARAAAAARAQLDARRAARPRHAPQDGRGLAAALTRAPPRRGLPFCTYRPRALAASRLSRVRYAPEAQGCLPPGPHVWYVLGARTRLGRTVRTACPGCHAAGAWRGPRDQRRPSATGRGYVVPAGEERSRAGGQQRPVQIA